LYDAVTASHQWKEGVLSMADAVRWSYGAGLVLRLGGIARLELNYVVPVKVQPNDRSVCLSVCLSCPLSVSVCLYVSCVFYRFAFICEICKNKHESYYGPRRECAQQL